MLDEYQIYVVVDIENNGPAPGLYSMLAIGATATSATDEVSTFYRTIEPLEGAGEDEKTMEWWRSQPEAWQDVRKGAQPPAEVMQAFCEWIDTLGA